MVEVMPWVDIPDKAAGIDAVAAAAAGTAEVHPAASGLQVGLAGAVSVAVVDWDLRVQMHVDG